MKTAFRAKLIFETQSMSDLGGPRETEFNMMKMRDAINTGELQVECILNLWENVIEPTIIIKERDKKEVLNSQSKDVL